MSFPSNIDLSTLNGTNGFKISGVAAFDDSGFSVASAGDINGDGIDDLIIGAPGSQTQLLMSAVYVQPDALPLIDGRLINALAQDEEI